MVVVVVEMKEELVMGKMVKWVPWCFRVERRKKKMIWRCCCCWKWRRRWRRRRW